MGRRFNYHLQRVKDISTRSARQTSHHGVWDRARDERDQLPDQCFHARSINQAKHGDRPAIINGRGQRRLTQKVHFSPPKAVGHLLTMEENVIPKDRKLIQHGCTQRSHLRLGPAVGNHTRGSFGAWFGITQLLGSDGEVATTQSDTVKQMEPTGNAKVRIITLPVGTPVSKKGVMDAVWVIGPQCDWDTCKPSPGKSCGGRAKTSGVKGDCGWIGSPLAQIFTGGLMLCRT